MSKTTKSAIATLEKFTKARQARQITIAGIKREREAYETETQALQLELSARHASHPEEFDRDGNIPLPDTQSDKLSKEIKGRREGPNPVQEKLDAAIDAFHAAERAEHEFRTTNYEQLVAECQEPAAEAATRIYEAFQTIADEASQYRSSEAHIMELVRNTPQLTGQHVKVDERVAQWERQAREILDTDLILPGITNIGQDYLAQQRANLEATDG